MYVCVCLNRIQRDDQKMFKIKLTIRSYTINRNKLIYSNDGISQFVRLLVFEKSIAVRARPANSGIAFFARKHSSSQRKIQNRLYAYAKL